MEKVLKKYVKYEENEYIELNVPDLKDEYQSIFYNLTSLDKLKQYGINLSNYLKNNDIINFKIFKNNDFDTIENLNNESNFQKIIFTKIEPKY